MNKIYKKSIVDKVCFPEDRPVLEDAYWTSKILELANRIVILPDAKYFYRKVEGSLSHKKRYTQEEKAGIHRNKLEKYRLAIKYCSATLINDTIATDLWKDLDLIFISNNDLTMCGVTECMKEVLDPKVANLHKELFEYIQSDNNSNLIHKRS